MPPSNAWRVSEHALGNGEVTLLEAPSRFASEAGAALSSRGRTVRFEPSKGSVRMRPGIAPGSGTTASTRYGIPDLALHRPLR